jgi:glyoxylase-like metal-dependent hydrolase (beta-lactamase superfamily II)
MSLTVRAYNVLFGDCILLSWDEDDGPHHAWVDFGNMPNDPNRVFDGVYDDVRRRTRGRLDLVLVTHRHLDHLEGFHACRRRFAQDFQVDRLWHAHVSPALDDVFRLADQAMTALLPRSTVSGEGELGRLYRNNHDLSTRDRMAEILGSFPAASTHAVHRQLDLQA